MIEHLREDASAIISASIEAVKPDEAVKRALCEFVPGTGRTILVSVGKAAWQMASTAVEFLGEVDCGIVITKEGHIRGNIPRVECYEGGHPIPNEGSFSSTKKALDMTCNLSTEDSVVFLLSGGGSALFESPLVSSEELQDITQQLLSCGANIVEINTIRKRLSEVKGGRFALHCAPAQVFCIVISDILGDPLDMIASGPVSPDSSTCEQAICVAHKYNLKLSPTALELLRRETPKTLTNVTTYISGSVRELCLAAKEKAEAMGYESIILTDRLCCEAREAGSFIASIVQSHANTDKPLAFISGGETIVHLTGNGLGGRNQEIALAAAEGIAGLNAAIFSIGSDGTDGPTDAAGGYADGDTWSVLQRQGISVYDSLQNNDAYTALKSCDGLIHTGPTGTNVNDVAVALIQGN